MNSVMEYPLIIGILISDKINDEPHIFIREGFQQTLHRNSPSAIKILIFYGVGDKIKNIKKNTKSNKGEKVFKSNKRIVASSSSSVDDRDLVNLDVDYENAPT